MISERKQYKLNKEKIQYEPIATPLWKRFFRFILISSIYAGAFTLIILVFFGSPSEIALKTKIGLLKKNFISVNTKIDSLESTLHKDIFPVDKFYRQVLELDSLPSTVRYAGMGGSEPIVDLDYALSDNLIVETNKKVNILEQQLKIQKESFNKIFNTALKYNESLVGIPAIQPVKPTKYIWTSSMFGSRQDPFTFVRRYHKGIDFVGPRNTEIFATADGTVTLTKESRRGYGKEIDISHSFGYSTRYAHLNEILVKEGQKVKRGELIGLMGNTGRSTGTHLHYEVRLNNRPINPVYYFSDDLDETEYDLIVKQLKPQDGN